MAKKDKRRIFTGTQRKEILYQQDNKCARCHKKLDPRTVEFDHKKPWASGGRTIIVNGRALCPNCHRIVTHNTRLKKLEKNKSKKNKRKRKEKSLFGEEFFGLKTKKRRKKSNFEKDMEKAFEKFNFKTKKKKKKDDLRNPFFE
jgi:predicted HNH restriction endonuclease